MPRLMHQEKKKLVCSLGLLSTHQASKAVDGVSHRNRYGSPDKQSGRKEPMRPINNNFEEHHKNHQYPKYRDNYGPCIVRNEPQEGRE